MVDEVVQQFFAQFPARTYHKGEVLLLPGGLLDKIRYIAQGVVAQYDITDTGNRVILNTFKAGAFFPMSHAVNDVAVEHFFEAGDRVVVYEAPVAATLTFVQQHPDVLYDLLQRTYRGTDGLLARMSELMGSSAQGRILTELEISAARFGTTAKQGGRSLQRKITTQELAERTGLARETVSRTLVRMKAVGIIEKDAGHFVLRNNE